MSHSLRLVHRGAIDGWVPEPGDKVELRRRGVVFRKGTVETVMPNGSGFWVNREGVDERAFVPMGCDDVEIWSYL